MNVLMHCCKSSLIFVATSVLFLSTAASAHQGSEGYVQLQQTATGASLQVDAALRDLDVPLKVDADGNGQLTAGEVKAAWPAIDAYVKSHVQVLGCELSSSAQKVVTRDDAAYASLVYAVACVQAQTQAVAPAIRYTLFKDIDANHRATARIEWAGVVTAQVLNPQETVVADSTNRAHTEPWAFVREGIHHIVTGYDHVLFLLCLLFPSVMRRTKTGWVPVEQLSQALWPVLGIVTAFTVAHSITLTLAALQWVSLPASLIEPLIAVTIAIAALDNLRPVLGRRRFLMTFLFGLIHGFGFAGVLQELELPTSAFVGALLQFNLGLELGQVTIVAAVAGLLFCVRERAAYVPWVIRGGSIAAIAVAVVWFIERTADVSLLQL
jgi:HupE / UreJ protein